MPSSVFEPLELTNGKTLKNRLVKAAMEEGMADAQQRPGHELCGLYQRWAEGGVGVIITGNVMVDSLAMTGPGGVALQADADMEAFKRWAAAAKTNNTQVWMQINHPGRQVYKSMGGKALAPSAVALDLGKHSDKFATPKAMTEAEIEDVIERFVTTASQAQKAGFDGVQVHAAHGYLLAQFLSPLSNQRHDQWGGALENRSRLLLEIVQRIHQQCGEGFTLSVKLNSADFQRGGFDIGDAEQVVAQLEGAGVHVVELSGGSYESPAMQGRTADGRTLDREAYFLEFAERISSKTKVTIMTTGGVRRLATANRVVANGVELVGIASAMSFKHDLPNIWQTQPDYVAVIPPVNWKDKTMAAMATMSIIRRQLVRLGRGKAVQKKPSPAFALIADLLSKAKLTRRYRKLVVEG
ncbi:NADH:flavin oxidoreductase/NADH oxidase family protein [Maricurvus nonylphenolicus]|uniref:NADH:flavin oxidoreductase/NADH oxidase family protein n=1 Tax=Maricurvus nonylphenolicus TaxID=1008307 RepID=UPI0036F42DCB